MTSRSDNSDNSEDTRALDLSSIRIYRTGDLGRWRSDGTLELMGPIASSGKIDRNALPPPEMPPPELERSWVAPRTPTEEVLASIWCEVLHLKQVGVHDNFFELGGHSLRAMQVVARLAKLLKLDLPLQRFFDTPTISAHAADLQRRLGAGETEEAKPIVSVPRTGNLPLSFAQQRLWFLDQLLPDKAAYNIPVAWRLKGQLDTLALQRSLNELVARHETLRTRFVLSGDQPAQVIGPVGTIALPITDLCAVPQAEREARARQITEAREPFDLEAGPLLRAQLLRLAAEEHLLLLNVHHIVSDGWSMGVLWRELASGYAAFVNGKAPDLPRLPIQYADYAVWQREWLQGEVLERQLAYWKEKLADLSTLELPTDRPRPPVPNNQGALLTFDLPASLTQALKELSYREGATLFMTLLAAFKVLLHRYSGQDDIAVGTPIAGRGRTELEGLIGLFVNTLVLRSKLSGNPRFTELLAQVHETALDAYTHQDLPFEKLVEELSPSRDISRNPLFDVMINLIDGSESSLDFPGLVAQQISLPSVSAKFAITLYIQVHANRVELKLVYQSELFSRARVANMLEQYVHLLGQIAIAPEKSINTYSLLTDNELRVSDVEDSYPLSSLQHGMLFHALWEKGSGVDIVQILTDLHESLDVEKFKRAWWRTITRHAVLRTSFRWENLHEPQQQVHAKVDLPWEEQDWRAFTDIEREKWLADLLDADRRRGFDMARAPLFRLTLLRYDEADYRLIWTYHHILLDGGSRRLVQRDVFAYYEAFLRDEDITRPQPRPYRDYIDWLQRKDFDRDESFWRQRLTGFTSATRLSVDHARELSEGAGNRSGAHEIKLSTEITSALRSMAEQNGLTLATIILGAWAILLSRYSGEADVVFGIVCSNRRGTVEGADDMVGLCINTLPMRVQVNSEIPLLSWLKDVRGQWITIRDYTHTPLAKVQGWSEVPVGHPLLSTVLSFQNYKLPTQGSAWSSRPVRIIEQTNYPVGLLADDGAELHLTFFLDRERIDDDAAGRMLGHLRTLLEGMATKPDRKVGELPLLTSSERHQLLVEWNQKLLVEWNQTEVDYPRDKCVHQLFEAQVERTPDAIALTFDGAQMTYRELNQRANQLARYLQKLGVGPETLAGFCIECSLEMIIGLLGILKAGGAYVPLDPENPHVRLTFMLHDANVSVLITQARLAELILAPQASIIRLDADWPIIASESKENLKSTVTTSNLAYVIYTSGSTGRPKGVMITHRNIVRLFQETKNWFDFNRRDVWTLFHSYAFDFSVWEIWGALLRGGRLVVVPYEVSRSSNDFYKLLIQEGVTILNQTPSAFKQLIQVEQVINQPESLALRYVIFGGEKLEMKNLIPWFDRRGDGRPQLVNMYGITEATVHVTYRLITKDDSLSSRSVIGVPIPDLQIYILDTHGQPLPIGIAGEMYIGGEGLARGYWNRPQLTEEKFVANPFDSKSDGRLYKSGDIARYLRDGNIEFLGRIDDQVKIRGYRIELGEIESVLRLHPAAKEAVVVAREDVPSDRRLVAYVAPASAADQAGELREFLKERLPAYMVPSAFVFIDAFPLTPNGKLDRNTLPSPERRSPELDGSYVAPRTPTEEALASIWRDVLNLKLVGIHDNFFELGGHSLLATQVISRVRNVFQVEIGIRALFEEPTIADFAKRVDEVLREDNSPEATPVGSMGRTQPLSLSFAQERLWFIDQLEPGSAVYNMPLALCLGGALDVAALLRSLEEVVQRHEALRTRFEAVADRPVQVVEPVGSLEMPFIDLSAEPKREADVMRLCREEARRPYDLARDLMLRARLFRLERQRHLLLLNLHHIAADGWSVGVLLRELGSLYKAFCQEQASPLQQLPIQYADFAAWQRDWLRGEVLEQQLGYWRTQLAGAPALLELPTDRPRPARQSYRGAKETAVFPNSLLKSVKALSQQEGTSLFMTLLAAFQTLLNRYSGQEDMMVGSPIAGRNRMELEGLIGFFVNTLVLRGDLSGSPTFREVLRRVKEVTLGAYAHQDLPFEKLVEELRPERNLSYQPLFQVMFSLENLSAVPMQLDGVGLSLQEVSSATSKFDLTMFVSEGADGLKVKVEYCTDLFDAATVRRMLSHYQVLLEGIVANPAARIAELPLLTEAERHQLVVEWNQTEVDYPRDKYVHQLFEAQAERTPDAVAVVFEQSELTYAKLNSQSNQLARYLQRHGVKPGSLVACYMERSSDLIVTLLAILKSGGAYVALEAKTPSKRLHSILEDARSAVIVVKSQQEETAIDAIGLVESAQGLPIVICLDQHAKSISNESTENLDSETTSEDQAYVCFTSGSSGQPKGVCIPHRAIVRLVKNTTYVSLSASDVFLQVAPVSFDASTFEIWACLLNGGQLVVLPSEMLSLAQLGSAIRKYNVSVLWLTAGLFHEMVDHELDSLTGVRQLLAGGDVLSIAHVRRALEHLREGRLINGYGPTENTTFTCCYSITRLSAKDHSIPIGRPISNTQCFILDRDLQPVPIGVRGELFAGGDGLARGYLNDPKLTAEKFISNPFRPGSLLYRTGDFARYRSDGNIEFLGRIDNQVKIRGYRIELGEIESVLKLHPAAKEALVVAREDVPGDRRLVAYVAPASAAAQAGELQEFLKERLPSYMLPSAFVFIDAFPLTANGKLDRKALPPPEMRSPELEGFYVAPRTPTEEVLASIWCDVLNLRQVGIHDNFFELGGHSLLAVKLRFQIQRILKIKVSLAAIYKWPTIEGIALSVLQQELEALGAKKVERLFAELEGISDDWVG